MRPLALAALALCVACVALWSLGVGSSNVTPLRIWQALWHGGTAREDLVVLTVRLPRVLAALAVGAALAAAGAMLQAVTRNPLADPGILGINAGAAFAVVLLLVLGGADGRGSFVWAGFLGAGATAALVHLLGTAGRQGGTPLRLTLAGVVVGSFFLSITSALLILDAGTFESVRIWTVGALTGIRMEDLRLVAPWITFGLIAALLTRSQLAVLAMGDEIATGLGLDQRRWWALAVAMVALLAGGAVALAGPVGFVGLIVPHAIRLITRGGYAAQLPMVMLAGAGLVTFADTLPRALWGRDIPVGVALAIIGAPAFIWLAQRRAGPAA